MSAVVRRALPLLKVLVDAKPKLKKAIIQHAPTEYTFPESTSRLTRFSTEDHLKWNRFEVCFSRAMVREAEHPSATHA